MQARATASPSTRIEIQLTLNFGDAEQSKDAIADAVIEVEKIEFERPKLRVRVTLYPKYACASHAECGIAQPCPATQLRAVLAPWACDPTPPAPNRRAAVLAFLRELPDNRRNSRDNLYAHQHWWK